jgi:hypothetical protein
MDELSKNKKRALRRKRDVIAKHMKENKIYHEKVVEKKRTRRRLRVQEIDRYLEEEGA